MSELWKNKWANKSVLVCHIKRDKPGVVESLHAHFESNDLSGGGPIEEGGICITESKKEAVISFLYEKDAFSVKNKRNHNVVIDGEEMTLEVLRCPATIHTKYFKEQDTISEGSSHDTFISLDKSEIENSDTIHLSDLPDAAQVIQRDGPLPTEKKYLDLKPNRIGSVYQSKFVEFQKEAEEKLKLGMIDGHNKTEEHRSTSPYRCQSEADNSQNHSSIEKAQYECTEKENPHKNGGSMTNVTENRDDGQSFTEENNQDDNKKVRSEMSEMPEVHTTGVCNERQDQDTDINEHIFIEVKKEGEDQLEMDEQKEENNQGEDDLKNQLERERKIEENNQKELDRQKEKLQKELKERQKQMELDQVEKERQMEIQNLKKERLEKEKHEEELERQRQLGKEEKERQMEKERLEKQNSEREIERQRQLDEEEKEWQVEVKRLEKENHEKQLEIERLEKEKHEREFERQRQLDKEEKERQMEKENLEKENREREIERQRQLDEEEKERQVEVKRLEKENCEKQLEIERLKKEKHEIERQRQCDKEEKEKQMEKERLEKEKEWQRQLALEKQEEEKHKLKLENERKLKEERKEQMKLNINNESSYKLPKPLKEDDLKSNRESESKRDECKDDIKGRTVILKGLTPELNIDIVEVYFESTKHGGGPLQSIDYQENSEIGSLVFLKEENAKNVLAKGSYTIEGQKILVSPFTEDNYNQNQAVDNDDNEKLCQPIKIRVSGINPGSSAEMLMLLFESERKSGGGELESFEMESDKRTAMLVYKDTKVAERVLARKTLKFSGNQMTVTKVETPVWDKKTIYVTGFINMSEDDLELLYENRRKSGGGTVEAVVMDKDGKGALVTFETEKDAARVLHQGLVKRRDGTVVTATKPSLETKSSDEVDPTKKQTVILSRSITVLGLDENITDDLLEMFFENENKSGGGPVEKITIDTDFGIAVLTFEDCKVAERVLSKGEIKLNNLTLIIQPHMDVEDEPSVTPEKTEDGATGGQDIQETKKPIKSQYKGGFNCIEVTGLKAETPKDFVALFFENYKKSGGGEIEDVSYNPEQGTAIITFTEEKTTKSVLQRQHDAPLMIDGNKLQIRPIDTSLFDGRMPTAASCAIEVTGIPVNVSEETLLMFFENRRMSGGDNLDEIVLTSMDGRAVLTYKTTEVAQRVIEMHKSKPLEIEHAMLQVRMLSSNSRPSQVVGPKEANTLFIKNIPDGVDPEDIRQYLERVPKCKVQEIIFGVTAGTALVHFVFAPGYEKFYELTCQKPFQGNMIDIESVARSKSLEVFGISGLSKQKLQMYFEHNKSGGGEVEKVEILQDEGCVIITFVKHGVAENVLKKTDHTLEKHKLVVGLHHSCIGLLPPDHDQTTPSAGIPANTAIKQYDRKIVRFVMSTPSNKKYVQDSLRDLNGEIIWPNVIFTETKIIINCTLHRNIPNLKQKVKTWEGDIHASFDAILANYHTDEINVLKEAWQEFLKVSGDLSPSNTNDAQITVDHDTCTVSAIGKKYVVEQMMDTFRQAINTIEEAMNRQKQVISEPVTNLKTYQIKFLLAHKFPQSTKQVFQDMKIEADMKNCKIVFTGVPSDIITAKLQMYELVSQMRYEKLKMAKSVCTLIKLKKTRDFLVSEFQKRDIVIVTDVINDTDVLIYAKTPEELTSGVAVLRNCVIERNVDIPESSRPIFMSEIWRSLRDTILSDFDGEVKLDEVENHSTVHVTATGQVIDGILETIQNFIKENTVLENFVNMERGTALLMNRESKQEMQKITDDFRGYSVKIIPQINEEKPGILVCATKDGLVQAVSRVQKLAQDIMCCKHIINKPGMPKYFHDERGKNVLASMENRFKVVIVTGDKGTQNTGVDDFTSSAGASASVNRPRTKSKVTLPSGRSVHVVQGDLTLYKVDAIVNAANERMEHVGGIAKAIVDKGGLAIQKECSKYISVEGRLLSGQVYTSDAGKLPCGKVIHTVGPKWQGGHRNEENELYEAVYAALTEAGNYGMQSLALPAISSGVYGFPKRKCCILIAEAIKDYLEKEASPLKEVHFVDTSNGLIDEFHQATLEVFGTAVVQDMEQPQTYTQRSEGNSSFSQAGVPGATGGGTPYWTKSRNKLTTQEGVTVTLIKGSIVSQKVNVVINTTNAELNLSSGGVSKLIVEAAGPGIQQECKNNAPGGVKAGDIVQTSGGNTKWKKIYHGSCPHYSGPQNIKTLEQFVTKCLTTAHASGFSSIAVPAIGTGNLKYPRPDVAKSMYEQVKIFSQNHQGTPLTDIKFVVYDKDSPTVQAFEAEADRLKKAPAGGAGAKPKVYRRLARERVPEPEPEPTPEFEESDYSILGTSHSEPQSVLQQGEVATLYTEHLTITLVKGDITKETTNAIVNPSSSDLNLGSQVAKAILREGGEEIKSQCAELGQVDRDHLAVTSAGKLGCRYIIHVEAPWDNFRYITKWKERIGNTLKKADDLWCASVSFPALGTGTMSTDPSKMAEAMFEAFHIFGKKAKNLQNIRVVVYEDKMINTFQKQLEKMGNKKKGFVEIITDAVQSLGSYFNADIADDTELNPYVSHERHRDVPTSRFQHPPPGPIDPAIMTFHIYGFSQSSCDQVAQSIDKTCDSETQDKVLDSLPDQKIIKKLTDEQIRVMKGWERGHNVKITVDRGQRLCRIRIQGGHQNVLDIMDKIYQVFREVEQAERDKEEAELLAKQAQWQFDDGTGWQQYPAEINVIIEKAYLNKDTYAEFKEEDDNGPKTTRVTFSTMLETDISNPSGSVKVRRYTSDTVELPATWTPMKKDQRFDLIDLTAGSPEFKDIEKKFSDSFKKGGGTTYNSILKIQRLQNPSMYQKYEVHKNHMEAANPQGTQNEKELWHGTSDDTLDEIHTNGFNRSFCGKNGTAYGRGVYFATYATLSSGYAKPNANGHKHMYLCCVLSGEFTKGDSSLLVPPPKDPQKPNIKFDTVVDNTTTPKIFVVFQDTQAYPEYLIRFT